MKKIFKYLTVLILIIFPATMFADDLTATELFTFFGSLLKTLLPMLVAFAVLLFVYGITKYIWHGGDEEKRKEGGNLMVYGVISLFVIIALWGLVNLVVEFLFAQQSPTNLDNGDVPQFPIQ